MDSMFQDFYKVYSVMRNHDNDNSTFEKTYIMAYIADFFTVKKYVEIGVYNGRSFFPMTQVMKRNNGFATGIDLRKTESVLEYEPAIEVNAHLDMYHLNNSYEIICETSNSAIIENIEMLCINGKHEQQQVLFDSKDYISMVDDGGFIIFDNINTKNVSDVYTHYREEFIPIYEEDIFGILMKKDKNMLSVDFAERLNKKLRFLRGRITGIDERIQSGEYYEKRANVGIGILTYNHAEYIQECLNGVFMQKGNFNATVIIIDDCSTDNNVNQIHDYFENNPWIYNSFHVKVIVHEKNMGAIPSFKEVIRSLDGYDYAAMTEGDDYWTDPNRIQTHIELLRKNPECAISFNSLKIKDETKNTFFDSDIHENLRKQKKAKLSIDDLVDLNWIGNNSCSFYNQGVLSSVPDDLFNMNIGDWMLNIYCSQMGDIVFEACILGVYRHHTGGVWSKMNLLSRLKTLVKCIDEYNDFLNYSYDKPFTLGRNGCLKEIDGIYVEETDLVIIDDIFPLALSGFRYVEFTTYLKEIESSRVLCAGQSIPKFTKKSIESLIIDYKREHNGMSGKLSEYSHWLPIKCKLLYFIFPTNAFSYLPIAEQYGIPFVFTLYPGGGFSMDDPLSDSRLKMLFSSPCFRKVIVTQRITKEYLLKNNLCPPSRIEFIWGGVLTSTCDDCIEECEKVNYGIEKDTLDICFVAMRYAEKGEDKGYDLFVEAAKVLCQRHGNIRFHVAGSFDEDVIDISEIKDRITFHGKLEPEELTRFFIEKDIILSPNINGILTKGAFDGFPTGSCVEAGLKKTAIFCTDPLDLNENRLIDGEEIVIVEHDTVDIIEKIEYYYNNHAALEKIKTQGAMKLKQLFSYECQMRPRIDLLKAEIEIPLVIAKRKWLTILRRHLPVMLKTSLMNRLYKIYSKSPESVKKVFRLGRRIIHYRR